MVFGEIVEPSSRALWDDEFTNFPQTDRKTLKWTHSYNIPPTIHRLLVIESTDVINFVHECTNVRKDGAKVCALENGSLQIHQIDSDIYVVVYKPEKDVCAGEVLEMLIPWMKNAEMVLALTSSPIALLQNYDSPDNSACIVQSLQSNLTITNPYPRLRIPNLITGFAAAAFTYCRYQSVNCLIFIAYLDYANLDSSNCQPLVDALQFMGLKYVKPYCLKFEPSNKNLYM